MRVEIREMIVRAKVGSNNEKPSNTRERSNAVSQPPMTGAEREALINECLRRMKQLLNDKTQR